MGVATGDMGVARDGSHKGDYQPGMELHGKYTCLLYTSPSPRDRTRSRMPSSACKKKQ